MTRLTPKDLQLPESTPISEGGMSTVRGTRISSFIHLFQNQQYHVISQEANVFLSGGIVNFRNDFSVSAICYACAEWQYRLFYESSQERFKGQGSGRMRRAYHRSQLKEIVGGCEGRNHRLLMESRERLFPSILTEVRRFRVVFFLLTTYAICPINRTSQTFKVSL